MTPDDCTCPHEIRSYGRLYGIGMGRGPVRLSTTKGCPVHDACHRWTVEARKGRPPWSNPFCPVHGIRDCPDEWPDTKATAAIWGDRP